ncbi:MAG: hypothetical protein R2854_23460 [Caldilineaceae bacterium]
MRPRLDRASPPVAGPDTQSLHRLERLPDGRAGGTDGAANLRRD